MSLRLEALAKYFRLPTADRALLRRTGWILVVARVGLWLLPLRVVRRYLARLTPTTPETSATAERIGWAVSVAKRVVPRATCLPQALAAEALLAQDGHSVSFRIGVIKNAKGRIEAHAWVESEGRIVVGELDEGLSAYTPLPPLPGAQP